MDQSNNKRTDNKSRMTEKELLYKWNLEKPIYEAWGSYIRNSIFHSLEESGLDLDDFFKIPVTPRLKKDRSLVDKAFNRNKPYADPYNNIEDKVGIRFIVLLLDHIKKIKDIIEINENWDFENSRDFEGERSKNPLLFDYQSVHYILKPTINITTDEGMVIPVGTTCEVQIRTLLQHAHAELTHDAIYKSKAQINPPTHRKVARSMALIETADDFFGQVNCELNTSKLEETNLQNNLNSLYKAITGIEPITEKSSIIIWDEYDYLINDKLYGKIEKFYQKKSNYIDLIKDKLSEKSIYRQSIILFLIWLADRHPQKIDDEWPISFDVIRDIMLDCGLSYFRD
jgi:ppGpp synthetase/RelA/SpoT-type nucleotidyltranferase